MADFKQKHRSPQSSQVSQVQPESEARDSAAIEKSNKSVAGNSMSNSSSSSVEDVEDAGQSSEAPSMKIEFFNPDEASSTSATTLDDASKVNVNRANVPSNEEDSENSSLEEGSSYSSSSTQESPAVTQKSLPDSFPSTKVSSTPSTNDEVETSRSIRTSEASLQVPSNDDSRSATSNESSPGPNPALTTSSVMKGDSDFISEQKMDYLACSHPAGAAHRKPGL